MAGESRRRPVVTFRLQLILLGIVAAVAALDLFWVNAGHFDIDIPAYCGIALLAVACAMGGLYYERIRRDERLAAMLIGTGFLIAMSASFSVLNYLLISVAGARIDTLLSGMDRALGVDWPALMVLAARHPHVNGFLQLVYVSVLPQIALLVVALGWHGQHHRIYSLCLAVAAGAAISIATWTLAPSFGAFSVYDLPASATRHLSLALDARYAKELVALLAHGPGHIAPSDAKGLIGFPSYHAVLALLVVWYARQLPFIRWLCAAVNALVLVATPIQGGHHVIDVIAGFAVAALCVVISSQIANYAARSKARQTVEAEPSPV